jgi:diguanylate cyclase (GGDEF)-like protein/PAS domain S-box-containing protein
LEGFAAGLHQPRLHDPAWPTETQLESLTEHQIRALLQELRIYQIELETQNEELREAQLRLRETSARYADLYDFAPVGYFSFDEKGLVETSNFTGCAMLGVNRRELLGQPFSRFVDGASSDILHVHLRDVFRQETRQSCELSLIAGGHVKMVTVAIGQPEKGRCCRSALIDITAQKRAEGEREALLAEVQHLAYHDALTGLPNRVLFNDRLAQAIVQSGRLHPEGFGLLMLDLDGFKEVNDTLGHEGGDLLLQEIGRRILKCVRAADTVARYGGDEFVVLLMGIEKAIAAEQVARKILEAVREPVTIHGRSVSISASIGISLFPWDAGSADELRKKADAAMYRAKTAGKGCYRLCTCR